MNSRNLRVSSTLKNHLFTPLYASFIVLFLLIVGQQSLLMWTENLTQEAVSWVTNSLVVEREGERLLNAVLDEEKAALEIDINEEITFHRSFSHLYDLVKDNPDQLQQLNHIKYLYERWKSPLAKRVFSLSTIDYPSSKESLFQLLHTEILIFIDREDNLLHQRKYQLQQLYHVNSSVNIILLITLLVGAVLNFLFLHQRVKVPLRELTQIGKVWQKGQMEPLVGYSSSDEIGQLAGVLNEVASETRQRQQHIETRNQQLEDLICALSHDIRTPLLATRNTIQSMLKGAFGSINCTWREIFEEYYQSNEDLLKLVETILDVSRYETARGAYLNHDPLDWKRVFAKVMAQVKATSKREFALTHKIAPSLPTVYGDEVEIRRVLQNLLDNAIRVSNPNKEIVLEVASLGQNRVLISVSDPGPGIAPQEQERLFHRFTQGRGRCGKAGLGLYLCRQIVEAHGGNIGVKSTLGVGSTFWFTLPVSIARDECQERKLTHLQT
ncbi:ATP-binding protein [Tolypothrix campylonemoides VB511288_2]|uniref:histidine kinase n=3 Tax=Tolypothrix TaxID=111782 RepID=A0A0C1NA23_9CYAN